MRFYALIDPRDGAIRYVGRTVSALNIRLNSHMPNKQGVTGNLLLECPIPDGQGN